MNVLVSRATAEELDEVGTLFDEYRVFYGQPSDREAASQFLADRFECEDSVILLARDDDERAVGFAQLYPSFSSVGMKRIWSLNDLYVEESSRRAGVGTALITAVNDFARPSGAARVDLATAKENQAAKLLYEAMGFAADRVFDHYKRIV